MSANSDQIIDDRSQPPGPPLSTLTTDTVSTMSAATTVAKPLARSRHTIDGPTMMCYGVGVCCGYVMNGMGASMTFLQRDLHVTRAQIAWYPLLFCAGLIILGMTGERVVAVLGRRTSFWLAFGFLCSGVVGLGSTISPQVSAMSAAAMGAGGALVMFLTPAVLSEQHGALAAGALAESNAIGSGAAILAPLAIASMESLGVGWRVGLVVPPLIVAALVVARGRGIRFGNAKVAKSDGETNQRASTPKTTLAFFRRWCDIIAVVSIEFCFVFWTTDYMTSEMGVRIGAAPALLAFFIGGMAITRALGGQYAGKLSSPTAPLLLSLGLAAAGFVLFWSFRAPVVAAIGLLVSGTGVALLYPLCVTRALDEMPSSRDRASARAALASGIAIGGAPFVLAMLATAVGLRIAFLLVPILVAFTVVNTLVRSTSVRVSE